MGKKKSLEGQLRSVENGKYSLSFSERARLQSNRRKQFFLDYKMKSRARQVYMQLMRLVRGTLATHFQRQMPFYCYSHASLKL